MALLVVCAVSEITFLVTKFSRFSEEIFTGIVAIFFTYEATKSIIGVRLTKTRTHTHTHTYSLSHSLSHILMGFEELA